MDIQIQETFESPYRHKQKRTPYNISLLKCQVDGRGFGEVGGEQEEGREGETVIGV